MITKRQRPNDLAKWRRDAPNAFRRAGEIDVKAFDLDFAGSPIPCIQRFVGDTQVRISITCVNDGDLIIGYFGDEKGVSDFREILKDDVRRANQ